MCGIFSYFSNKVLTKKEIILCRKGISLLKHRGPDENGEWYDLKKGVYIGHQRLSIIDLTSLAVVNCFFKSSSGIFHLGSIFTDKFVTNFSFLETNSIE